MHEETSKTATTRPRRAGLSGEADRVAWRVTPAEAPGSGTSRVVAHSSLANLNLLEGRARRVYAATCAAYLSLQLHLAV
jgi:hypothetical protein